MTAAEPPSSAPASPRAATRWATWSLIAANAVPLIGVLCFSWSIFVVIFAYWMENLVVGFWNIARMLTARGPRSPLGLKLFLVPFFCVHYGGFMLVHGLFVVVMFGGGFGGNPFTTLADAFARHRGAFGATLLALMVSHGVSFAVNYIAKGEYRTASLPSLMARPYVRIVVLHITIIVGGGLALLLNLPNAAMAILVILKTLIDLHGHRKEHQKLQASSMSKRSATTS